MNPFLTIFAIIYFVRFFVEAVVVCAFHTPTLKNMLFDDEDVDSVNLMLYLSILDFITALIFLFCAKNI